MTLRAGDFLFHIATVSEKLRLDPGYFSMPVEQGLLQVAKARLEQMIIKDLGIVLSVFEAKPKSDGLVIHGDPAAYYQCEVKMLTYLPEINEIVEGEIIELMEFGAFQNLGPLDGLIHLSQITDDFMSFNKKIGAIVGKEKNKMLKKGDHVYSKVATISLKKSVNDSKIGLTMKAMGLGKDEWAAMKPVEKKENKQKRKKEDIPKN